MQKMDPAWQMLKEKFKPDSKGRYKTLDAMKVASHFASEAEGLRKEMERLHKNRSVSTSEKNNG